VVVEIGPEAVFIHPNVERDAPSDTPTRRLHDTASWHLIDAMRALTWCGIDIGYGNRRRLWSETPEDQRCAICIRRLRGAPAPQMTSL
jgi:hypothetical protein